MDALFKKLAIILVVGFFAACIVGFVYLAFFSTFPPEEKEEAFNAPAQKTLVIDNPGGLAHIVGAERNDLHIDAARMITPRLPFLAEGALARFQLIARAEPDRYYISARLPSAWRGACRLELQLEIPIFTRVAVNMGFGNVNLHQLRGAIEVVNRGPGTIVLEHVSGAADITAATGEIRGNLVGDGAPVRVKMTAGNILLNVHSTTPGPMNINIESGIVVIKVRPDVNINLAYRTSGTVINPFPTGRADPHPGENHPYAMKLGAGGAAFNIEAGSADLTIDQLAANE